MKRLPLLIFTSLLFLAFQDCKSQTDAKISKPVLELQGKQVKITYDIENYRSNDKFSIWIEIADADERPIKAQALTGDIGRGISGGKSKEIFWSPEDDGITLKEGITIQVFGELLSPPTGDLRRYSTTNIVLQSLLFPGLGLARATGKPHWIRGVAGYACIATSLAFHQVSKNNYDLYKDESVIETRDDLFNSAVSEDGISEAFAYAAIGIWIVDVVWNIVGSSRLNNQAYAQEQQFAVTSYYNPAVKAPMIALSIRF